MDPMDAENHETLARALFAIAVERWHPSIVNYELAEITGVLSSSAILTRALSDSGIPASENGKSSLMCSEASFPRFPWAYSTFWLKRTKSIW